MISWSVGRLVGWGQRGQGGCKKERCELEARWIQGGEGGAESLLETDPSEFERK